MPDKSEYQRLKERGICGRCGKNPPVEGHTVCATCMEKIKKNNRKQRSICDKCTKTLICDRDRSEFVTDCDEFDNKHKKYKDPSKQPIRPTRIVPQRWPYGWCYVCCQPITDKNKKLCKKHEDWIYLPKKKKETS